VPLATPMVGTLSSPVLEFCSDPCAFESRPLRDLTDENFRVLVRCCFRFCHGFATRLAESPGIEHRDDLLVGGSSQIAGAVRVFE